MLSWLIIGQACTLLHQYILQFNCICAKHIIMQSSLVVLYSSSLVLEVDSCTKESTSFN